MEGKAKQRETIAKSVWQLLKEKDPDILSVEQIRTTLVNAGSELGEGRCKAQQTSELTSILEELNDAGLIYLTEKIFLCQRKAGARLDTSALDAAVQKKFIAEGDKRKGPYDEKRKDWEDLLTNGSGYLSSVMTFYQSKASSFASLFIAVVFGLYALFAVMSSLYESPFLRTSSSLILASSLHLLIGCATAILWCIACLIAWQYYQYTRSADKASKVLYGSVPLRVKFVKITTPWEGRWVRPASKAMIVLFLLVTALVAVFLWYGLGMSL